LTVRNYIQPGETMTFTAPSGGVVSGSFYQIGQLLVCAAATIAEALSFEGLTRGVFSVTKPGSQAWTEGALIYWDDAAGNFTTVAEGNLLVGSAAEAVGSGSTETTGKVRLDGVARPNEST
jgi:predicted RecA/RadA family phage recombinase